ncbi:hypothetical protein PPACK8108_LOCUS14224 [Phakopsora pachyrhizi]|uniref:EGF-like domain-containing protein n=1 Tax=Phakopsora pachyrhizi TaxID=170000 RepID=A0AAV0B8B0_PHAPC|nr:hypothetical protein PPACK8108_LOCUS14224 [Phakopsora pachyrhizi]
MLISQLQLISKALILLSILILTIRAISNIINNNNLHQPLDPSQFSSSIDPFRTNSTRRTDDCPACPECFNCQLPRFVCKQYGDCNEYDGQCKCPAGFGGQGCGRTVCGSLADGEKSYVRSENSTNCDCNEGWTGVNCNGSVEFFYCSFEECNQSIQVGYKGQPNITRQDCQKNLCKCIPGKMLCGKSGRLEIKGPGKFSCLSDQQGCRIEEPAMNQLISDIFGDTSITLNCQSGECMHYTKVPEDDQSLFFDHIPTDLSFHKISHSVTGIKVVLREVSGKAKSGEFMAIMGAFGAGKSSLLDVLAKKNKSGTVEDKILINDKQISNNYLKNRNRAVLCNASSMRTESKKIRTLETLEELGILHIRMSLLERVVEDRSLEARNEGFRLPAIEPTIGLDSFNAYNVIESHAGLAKNYKRTVVFTIHQPQSNILALFDQLILLGSGGQLIFSGAFSKCHDSFENIEYPCPSGYNIADVLIDLMMTSKSRSTTPIGSEPIPSGKYLGNGTQLVSPHAESQQLNEELGGAEPHTIKTSYDSADSSQTKRKQKLSNMSQESSSRLRSILADSENDGSFLDELNQLFNWDRSIQMAVVRLLAQAIHSHTTDMATAMSNLFIYQPELISQLRELINVETDDGIVSNLVGIMYRLSSAFRLFNKANGLKVLVNRIKEEVDIAVSQCSTDNPSALKSSEVLIGILHQCSASLLKALTRSIQRLLTSAGTSEGVRNLNETKPSSAIKLIMQNRSILPTEIQSL